MKRPIFSRGWSDILRNGPTGCYGELFCISDILHLVLLQIFFWLSKVSVTIVKIRITLFWCLWWQNTVIEVKYNWKLVSAYILCFVFQHKPHVVPQHKSHNCGSTQMLCCVETQISCLCWNINPMFVFQNKSCFCVGTRIPCLCCRWKSQSSRWPLTWHRRWRRQHQQQLSQGILVRIISSSLFREGVKKKTLPGAQRTQGIASLTWV